MNVDELLEQYTAGRRDFREAILRDIDLEQAQLPGINLISADLREANLRKARLIQAQLGNANLKWINLSE
ncbi:MAG: pentapeptide repeat-containing protein, partial [Coleofasciculus sp. S288]|nr:pentapeptide repeat-containing protein [Coleofasciculus sp. S288]